MLFSVYRVGKHRGNIILQGRSKDQLEDAVDSYQDGSSYKEKLREPVVFSQVKEAGGSARRLLLLDAQL